MLPKIFVSSVWSMNVEDGDSVSFVLYRNCLEAVLRECLVFLLQSYGVSLGLLEVIPHIGEKIVAIQALGDGLLIAVDEKRCDGRAIRYVGFLEYKDFWKEEFVTLRHGVEVHGDKKTVTTPTSPNQRPARPET